MRMHPWKRCVDACKKLPLLCLCAVFLLHCGGGGGGGSGGNARDGEELPAEGVLNGPCFADGTCDGVLVCGNEICVLPPEADEDTDANNGGIGSACGSCAPGLTCVAEAPGGYCSKVCQRSEDCGAGALCYDTTAAGPLCLAACERDADCRQGYSCQGEAGLTACWPDAGDSGSGGNYTNASFMGCYAMDNEIVYRLLFDGVNRFADIQWTHLSGEIRYAGTYAVSGNQITFYYSDGEVKQYTFNMFENGFIMDGWYYYSHEQEVCE